MRARLSVIEPATTSNATSQHINKTTRMHAYLRCRPAQRHVVRVRARAVLPHAQPARRAVSRAARSRRRARLATTVTRTHTPPKRSFTPARALSSNATVVAALPPSTRRALTPNRARCLSRSRRCARCSSLAVRSPRRRLIPADDSTAAAVRVASAGVETALGTALVGLSSSSLSPSSSSSSSNTVDVGCSTAVVLVVGGMLVTARVVDAVCKVSLAFFKSRSLTALSSASMRCSYSNNCRASCEFRFTSARLNTSALAGARIGNVGLKVDVVCVCFVFVGTLDSARSYKTTFVLVDHILLLTCHSFEASLRNCSSSDLNAPNCSISS
jgi:hypothetical protein